MFTFFFTAAERLVPRVAAAQPAWCRDPLLHPDVQRMTARELADLPLPRGMAAGQTEQPPPGDGCAAA